MNNILKNIKVLVIGDPHGFDGWKAPLEYYRMDVENNIDDYDYIVFMGDYVDEFKLSNGTISYNLLEIINLKKAYPDKVVLLLGNHDLQYMFMDQKHRCSGYRPEMKWDWYDMFNKNKELFQAAFQFDTVDDHKYLFTHAGVHRGWYRDHCERFFTGNLADTFNMLFPNHDALFHVGWHRGGCNKVGGIFWADKQETYNKPLQGYHQIIGHTHNKEGVKHYDQYKGDFTTTTYVDCMPIWHEMEIQNVLPTFDIFK